MDANTLSQVKKDHAFAIFRKFLVRDHGFTQDEANMECEFIRNNGIVVTEYHYTYSVRRIGTTKVLTRKDRASIYQSLQNAVNHATFEE